MEIIPLTLYKEDPEFEEQVEAIWKNNPWWYGICHESEKTREGFWGRLTDPYDASRKTLYFLGHTKSQAIARMKSILSCQ